MQKAALNGGFVFLKTIYIFLFYDIIIIKEGEINERIWKNSSYLCRISNKKKQTQQNG